MKLIMETWNRFLKEQTETAPFEVGDVVEDSSWAVKGEIVQVYPPPPSPDSYGYLIKIISHPEEEIVGREVEYEPDDLIDYDFIKVG